MPFKINIGDKSGKTYKLELETEELIGKSLNDKIDGKELLPDLAGYEFEIAGTSDKAGFTSMENVEGIGLKKELLTYGKGMKKRSRKEGKKKLSNMTPKGLRLRRTVRGKVISPEITQINLKVLKQGAKPLSEVFSDQNKPKEAEKKEEVKSEEKKE
jgi:small subunit ribosomal protein S6e